MFHKFLSKTSARHWFTLSLAAFLVLVTLEVLLYWRNVKAVESGEIVVTQQRALILARAGSVAIADFLRSRKGELSLLSQDREIASLSNKELIRHRFEGIVDNLVDSPVSALLRIDKEGKIALLVNKERINSGEGGDVSDRDYFIWAQQERNQGKFYVGQPVFPRGGAHQGEMIFTLATPVFHNDQFDGVILYSFLISQFVEKYVLPLRLFEETRAFIVTDEGILIGGRIKELFGKNLIDYAKEKKWEGWESYVSGLEKGLREEGVGEWYFSDPNEQKSARRVVAFTPIKIDGTKISLFIATPLNVAIGPWSNFSQNQNFVLSVFILALLAVIFWIIAFHLAWRDGFMDGLKRGDQNQNGGSKKN
ncbi:hypothetical protein HY439_03600 [Candidatus Microgenomates bacterium]|nr:hypothetical protein [Candidatus Microgenomates bacterium]